MTTKRMLRSLAVTALAVGLVGAGAQAAQAAQPTADQAARGSVTITFGPGFVKQMFKAGIFMYGASEVSVGMGDSGSLSAVYPLNSQATSNPTTSIIMDPETGGLSIYNGPAEAYAGLDSIVVKRTGKTGVVNGMVGGPFSMDSEQFDKALTVFTISSAKTKTTSGGWTMDGNLTLTAEAASTLNTLLKTTVFTPTRVGNLMAEVSTR